MDITVYIYIFLKLFDAFLFLPNTHTVDLTLYKEQFVIKVMINDFNNEFLN